MFGLIVQIQSAPGQRALLAEKLLAGSADLPGCVNYGIALDKQDADAIWVTEVWESAELHAASLELPQVRAVIAEAGPLIAGFGQRVEVEPIAGTGV
jgi:quinol monooxygenase YgiN